MAEENKDAPAPWMCTTFSGKAAAYMLQADMGDFPLFWCTKSLVQPWGDDATYQQCYSQISEDAKQWMKDGDWKGIESKTEDFVALKISDGYGATDTTDKRRIEDFKSSPTE